MATKFPMQINNLRFSVNPTGLNVAKAVNFGTLPTQNGVKYQIWYDAPEVLTITGASAGRTAFVELSTLERTFSKTDKVSELFYKTRLYRGFITSMSVEHSTSHINQFTYTITFQLLFGEKFSVQDFAITRDETGIVAEGLKKLEAHINEPLNKLESSMEKLLTKL